MKDDEKSVSQIGKLKNVDQSIAFTLNAFYVSFILGCIQIW